MPQVTARDLAEISRFPGVLWKRYLKWLGLPSGVSDKVEDIPDRLVEYVQAGRMALADLRAAFIEFDEYSDKTVILFKAAPAALAQLNPGHFQKIISSTADAALATPLDNPQLSYTIFDPPQIRLSWIELHHGWDLRGPAPVEVDQPKIVVLEADIATGYVSLALDRPGRRHVHGASRNVDYFAFYTQLAAQTLNTPLVPIPLYKALKSLEPMTDLVVIKQLRPKGMQGKMILTCDIPDVRQMAWYAAVKNDPALREQARYHWQESPDGAQSPRACALFREVPTEIVARTGMIKFTQHTLAHEMEYVLGHVRAHA
jgi:hypothetical protein